MDDLIAKLYTELYTELSENPIGTVGLSVLLTTFTLGGFNKIKLGGYIHSILNLVGSGLLTIYAIDRTAPPFYILNGVWSAISFYKIVDNRFQVTEHIRSYRKK